MDYDSLVPQLDGLFTIAIWAYKLTEELETFIIIGDYVELIVT